MVRSSRGLTLGLDLWVMGLAAVLVAPVLLPNGGGLARDMVFVPQFALHADALGTGNVVPRAVPLDAVLALITTVVDGAVIMRVALIGVLVAAGCGAHRWNRSHGTPARAVMATAAVWNPYVVERLAMGQWALLAAYAALWWLVPATRRLLDGQRAAWASLVAWTTLASLTPTGGLLALLAVTSTALVRVVRRETPVRGTLGVLAFTAAWQLPWILPSLVGGSTAVSDPVGVEAFAARAERLGGTVATLIGTGGIWNPFVVPATSSTVWGLGLTVAAIAALVLGGRHLMSRETDVVAAAAVGFAIAALPLLPGGGALLEAAVVDVPGAGLLRDGQKWLAPYVALVVVAAGAAVQRIRAGTLAVVAAGVLPLVLLPDAAREVWPTVRPVSFPEDVAEAVELLSDAPASTGAALTLPWASYREYPWGNPLSAADPVARWADHAVVVRDDLVLPQATVEGEDPRAADVGRALRLPEDEVAEALAGLGIGWVLSFEETRPPDVVELPVTGFRPVLEGEHVNLYRLDGAEPPSPTDRGRTLAVAVMDVLWLVCGLAAAVLVGRRARAGARSRRGAGDPA